MGKKGGSSWLTAVKRAFRSPSKESDKKSGRRTEEHDQEEDEEKVLSFFFFGLEILNLFCFNWWVDRYDGVVCWVLCRRERSGDGSSGNPRTKKPHRRKSSQRLQLPPPPPTVVVAVGLHR